MPTAPARLCSCVLSGPACVRMQNFVRQPLHVPESSHSAWLTAPTLALQGWERVSHGTGSGYSTVKGFWIPGKPEPKPYQPPLPEAVDEAPSVSAAFQAAGVGQVEAEGQHEECVLVVRLLSCWCVCTACMDLKQLPERTKMASWSGQRSEQTFAHLCSACTGNWACQGARGSWQCHSCCHSCRRSCRQAAQGTKGADLCAAPADPPTACGASGAPSSMQGLKSFSLFATHNMQCSNAFIRTEQTVPGQAACCASLLCARQALSRLPH